jgi:hypothetical protein
MPRAFTLRLTSEGPSKQLKTKDEFHSGAKHEVLLIQTNDASVGCANNGTTLLLSDAKTWSRLLWCCSHEAGLSSDYKIRQH